MINWTIEEVISACGGTFYGEEEDRGRQVEGVVIDSRKAEKGYLFIATRGERVDGHSFIEQVLAKGAACALGEEEPKEAWKPYIRVKDSFQALKDIAAGYRDRIKAGVVGITGSVGKTSTKEFIASVLAQQFEVLKTQGNLNNEVGLPLTVLRIREQHEKAVLEMGISDFGEMHRLSRIARPDICVITNIGHCHLENLKSREGVLRAKTEIFDFMQEDGSVCINGDDDMLATLREVRGKKPMTFGLSEQNTVFADQIVSRGLLGSEALIHTPKGEFRVQIPLPGEHMVYNALAATAVGLLSGMSLEKIAAGIASAEAVGGRSHIIRTEDCTIIDDCYNANPVSVKAAIDLLNTAIGHKTAVLGDMFELGDKEEKLHAQVGAYAAEQGIERLIFIGRLSEHGYLAARRALEQAGSNQEVLYYPQRTAFLEEWCKKERKLKDTTVLVKASHGMFFEEIIKELVR